MSFYAGYLIGSQSLGKLGLKESGQPPLLLLPLLLLLLLHQKRIFMRP